MNDCTIESTWVATSTRCRFQRSTQFRPGTQHEDGDLPGKTDQPQKEGRSREPINQPGSRYPRHPRAYQRYSLPAKDSR